MNKLSERHRNEIDKIQHQLDIIEAKSNKTKNDNLLYTQYLIRLVHIVGEYSSLQTLQSLSANVKKIIKKSKK